MQPNDPNIDNQNSPTVPPAQQPTDPLQPPVVNPYAEQAAADDSQYQGELQISRPTNETLPAATPPLTAPDYAAQQPPLPAAAPDIQMQVNQQYDQPDQSTGLLDTLIQPQDQPPLPPPAQPQVPPQRVNDTFPVDPNLQTPIQGVPGVPGQPGQQSPNTPPLPFIEPQLPNPTYHPGPDLSIVRKLVIGLIIAAIVGLPLIWFIPFTRLAVVNSLGLSKTIRVTTVTASDSNKEQTLQNAQVTINGVPATTDKFGVATLEGVEYGSLRVEATKKGFETASYDATIDFNPFFGIFGAPDNSNEIKLKLVANGIPVTFLAVDWLSGKPITNGSFTVDEVTSQPDNKGLVEVYAPKEAPEKIKVSADFKGSHVNKNFEIATKSAADQSVRFVPAGKLYYPGTAADQFTIYRSDLDGTNAELVIKGTPQETNKVEIMVSPDGQHAILSSSRDGAKSDQGGLLQRVYTVDLKTKKLTRIDEGQSVRFGDWAGASNTFTYLTTKVDVKGKVSTTLRSVDAVNGRVYNFETASDIKSLDIVNDRVLYLRYDADAPESQRSPQLKVASIQGANPKTIGERVTQANIVHLAYGRIAFKSDAALGWKEYDMATDQSKTTNQPDVNINLKLHYSSVLNPEKTRRIYGIFSREFVRTLGFETVKDGVKKELVPASTFTRSTRWANNSVILFSLVTPEGAGDYVVSTDGGPPKKVRSW